MQKRNAKKKSVRSGSVKNVPKNTSVENRWTWAFILSLLAGAALLCAIPAYSATLDCSADQGKYVRQIEAVNEYIDYRYVEDGKTYTWHIHDISKPSEVMDWLFIEDNETLYSILYPAKCTKVK